MNKTTHPPLAVVRLSGFGKGQREEFDGDVITLGAEPASNLRFDPTWDKTVSPRHATLTWQGRDLWLADQSKDGSWIDGQRVTRRQLTTGTTIQLGRGGPKIRVEFDSEPIAIEPRAAPAARPPAPGPTQPAVVAALPPAPPPPPAPIHRSHHRILIVAVVALLALAAAALAFKLLHQHNADEQLAAQARENEPAVGLVVLVLPTPHGPRSVPMATAWAVGEKTFATNAHVAGPVQQALGKGGSAFIVISRHPELRYEVKAAVVHPKYGHSPGQGDRQPAIDAYDIGVLEVDRPVAKFFKIARKPALEGVDSGSRIAYLGFPMEGLAGDGVDYQSPVATMQSGIVTSVTDYFLSRSDFPTRLLIQHNLGATGGASGSPIFNPDGEVVGILCAGNIIGQVNFQTGEVIRAPSAAMVNFAQRVDVLREIVPGYPQD